MKTVSEFLHKYPDIYDRMRFDMLPNEMRAGYEHYVLFGTPMGDFGTATLQDKLVESFSRADDTNTHRMLDIVRWLYNGCPADARGSDERVQQWIMMGGLAGHLESQGGTG